MNDDRWCDLASIPLFERLAPFDRIMVSGAGGGFDVFAGLPLYFALQAQGKEVFLGNLSFSILRKNEAGWLTEHVLAVTGDTRGLDFYFPERYLSQFLSREGESVPVYAFEKCGVVPLAVAYRAVIDKHDIEAVVLVDGGTDSLMRGDEPGLGTPTEDMASVAAVDELTELDDRLLVCLGFGIDTFHGVCHHYFLEAVAELTAQGAFLGAFSCLEQMPEVRRYKEAVEFVHERMTGRPSIVNASIVSALEGHFGDVHRTQRTSGSKLYINPLMTLYFAFELEAVAQRIRYLQSLKHTHDSFEITTIISEFRMEIVREIRTEIKMPM